MKTVWLFTLIIPGLLSCAREIAEDVPDFSGGEIRTVLFKTGQIGTKTIFTDPEGSEYPARWTENDEAVAVSLNYATPVEASVSPSLDGRTATFSAGFSDDASGTYVFAAVSPASACGGAGSPAGTMRFSIPDAQTPLAGSPEEAAQILGAVSSASDSFPSVVSLGFRHLSAYGKLTLSGLPASETLCSVSLTAEEDWVGEWTWKPSDGTIAAVSGKVTRTLLIKTDHSSDIWFSCAPVDLGGKELSVLALTDKGVYRKTVTIPAGKRFESGHIASFTVAMPASEQKPLAVWTLTRSNMTALNGSDWTTEKDALRDTDDHTILADEQYPGASIIYRNNGTSASDMPSYEIWKADAEHEWFYRVAHARRGSSLEIDVPVSGLEAGMSINLKMVMMGNRYVVKNWLVEFNDGDAWQSAPLLYAGGSSSAELELDTPFFIDNSFLLTRDIASGVLHFRITPTGGNATIGGTNKNASAYFRIYGAPGDGAVSVCASNEVLPSLSITEGSSTAYTVVSSSALASDASDFAGCFNAAAGTPITTATLPLRCAKEILIASRDEASECASALSGIAYGYAIRAVGDKIVIAGTDRCWTVLAMEAFARDVLGGAYLGPGGLSIPVGFSLVESVADPQMIARLISAGHGFSLSATFVGSCAGTGSMTVAQGAASDGSNVFFVMRTSSDSGSIVFKYSLEPFAYVGESGTFTGYHSNDMTFDTANGRAIVVHGTGDSKGLTAVDGSTLALSEISTNIGIGGITYNASRNIYGITQGGTKYVLADASFKQTKNYGRESAATEASTDYTAQGMGSDDTYVYFPMSGSSDNILVVYDWSGNYVCTLHIPLKIESESMFYADGNYYVNFSSGGARLYRIEPVINFEAI